MKITEPTFSNVHLWPKYQGCYMGLFTVFSKGSNIQRFLDANAVVVDVRTSGEFLNGHLEGSINYPLKGLKDKIDSIKKLNRPVIFCCASGVRSAQAIRMLKKEGVECMNGGSWQSVARHC